MQHSFHTNIKAQLFSTLMIIKIFLEQQIGILKWFLKDCGFWSLNEHKTLKEDFKNFFQESSKNQTVNSKLQNIKKESETYKEQQCQEEPATTLNWLLIDIEININTVNLTDCTTTGGSVLLNIYILYIQFAHKQLNIPFVLYVGTLGLEWRNITAFVSSGYCWHTEAPASLDTVNRVVKPPFACKVYMLASACV